MGETVSVKYEAIFWIARRTIPVLMLGTAVLVGGCAGQSVGELGLQQTSSLSQPGAIRTASINGPTRVVQSHPSQNRSTASFVLADRAIRRVVGATETGRADRVW
ncbi:MAG: hypothetical protein AAFY27_03990 [Pseudomonadota bacterium]